MMNHARQHYQHQKNMIMYCVLVLHICTHVLTCITRNSLLAINMIRL